MKLQDYLHYYIGCKCQTPDGIGELVGLPWHIKQQDRATIHFGKIMNTENSIDRSAGKMRNHGDYLLRSERMEPIGSEGITDDGFDLPGGVRPILRRLEDMTEEEMIELFQSMVPDDMEDKPSNDEFTVNVFRGDGGNLVDENVAIGAEYSCRCFEGQLTIKKCGTICAYDEAGDEEELVNAPRAYHYLLQQKFDLFGLIDAGLAIDIKTLTP